MKKKHNLAVVLDEDLLNLLTSINKFDDLMEGKLFCHSCKHPVDENNLTAIVPKNGNFLFICNKPICFESFAE